MSDQGYLGDANAAYGIYRGASSGNPLGEARAGLQGAKLYGNLAGDSGLSTGAGDVLAGLNLYGGIRQGGVAGDTGAAVAATQLANQGAQAAGYTGLGSTALSTAGQYLPLVGEALGMYEAVNSPAVSLGPQYWNRLEQGLNSPQGSNDWNSSTMEMAASNDPAQLAALHARGIQTGNATSNVPEWQWYQPPGQSATSRDAARTTINQARGGPVKDPELHRKLKDLYADSFARKRQYDDGGGVNYVSYYNPPDTFGSSLAGYNPDPAYDVLQNDSGQGSPTQSNYWLPQYDQATGAAETAYQNAGGNFNTPSGPGSSGNSNGLSSLLNGLSGSGSGLGSFLQQYGALAPLLSALLGGNKAASAPSAPSGYGAIPSIPTPSYSRPYTQPNVQNWYTYGQGPEQSFFGNNQLPTVPGVSPGTGAAGAPASSSGSSGSATTQPLPYMGGPSVGLQMRAQGGSTFDSQQGDSYVQDPGHGDGTSDDIDAKLSGGEYVMDAGTVSMLGNGSNEAGSRALDNLRRRVRQHAGKSLTKGKQFMKAKAPESYLKGPGG